MKFNKWKPDNNMNIFERLNMTQEVIARLIRMSRSEEGVVLVRKADFAGSHSGDPDYSTAAKIMSEMENILRKNGLTIISTKEYREFMRATNKPRRKRATRRGRRSSISKNHKKRQR